VNPKPGNLWAEGVRRKANLGLKANLNLLVAWDPLWPAAFEDEKLRLVKALGPVARGIEHYGSTAVPGLCAKPILDIIVGISPLSEWERCEPALKALGYDYAEDAGVPGHYIFGRGRDRTERTHLVHVVEYQGESWCGSLAFRDALRRDAGLRKSYAQEKERAAAVAAGNRAAYNLKKGPFIAETIKKLLG
jgi:GrpB-like predicted nucleotidyltransferase (UPF0157 family)